MGFKQILYFILVSLAIFHFLTAASIPKSSIEDQAPSPLITYVEDADLTPRELISKYGYRGETHQVTTRDGYILTMHRITGPKTNSKPDGKPVIFLMHGLLSSSVDWFISGPGKGFAYILADEGYDVWMGNARGNKFSRKHKKHSVLDKEYWGFTWHEIGVTDLPTMIDYVIEETGQEKIFYAGHSQGTTSFFVMASEKPEYNDKIEAMFALAPVAFMSHMTSPFFRFLAKYDDILNTATKLIGMYEFQPNDAFLKDVAAVVCSNDAWTQPICKNIIFLVSGFGSDQLNMTALPAILGHVPAGAGTNQFLHYAQLLQSNEFRQLDYGPSKNMKVYGSRTPPAYELSNITVPVVFHYSENDWLSDVRDVNRLGENLPNVHAKLLVPNPTFGHVDFLWGINVVEHVYERTLDLMSRFRHKN